MPVAWPCPGRKAVCLNYASRFFGEERLPGSAPEGRAGPEGCLLSRRPLPPSGAWGALDAIRRWRTSGCS